MLLTSSLIDDFGMGGGGGIETGGGGERERENMKDLRAELKARTAWE